jgi:YVTN family beta-propeller protein
MGPTHGRMAYRCALVAAAVLAVSGLSAGMPSSLSAAAAGSRAYVTNNVDNTVSVIDMATNTVTATIAVGSNPGEVAVSADGSHAYVTNYGGGTVSVIDTSTNTVTATITVGSEPVGVALSPDGSHAYVANNNSGTVSVIDTATNTVTATITVGSNPFGVAVSPDGNHAYVTNENSSGAVSVIDTATNTVTATITVGSYPVSVAIGTPPAVSTPTTAGHQARATVCTTTPQPRVGEQAGRFLSVTVAAWKAGITDPTSALYNATPAIYVAGYGTMCGLSELATYGGNPANFTDSGTTVDETGTPTHAGADPSNGPSYEYYTLRH